MDRQELIDESSEMLDACMEGLEDVPLEEYAPLSMELVRSLFRLYLYTGEERSIGSAKVIASLEWLILLHGMPGHVRSDNGPEFIAKALQKWLAERGAKTLYITPGSPWENPYIESFHDKFRDECLNMHVFEGGRHAQEVVEAWRIEYNGERPHSSLNYMTPAEYAGHWRNSGQPTASLHCANAPSPGSNPETQATTLTRVGMSWFSGNWSFGANRCSLIAPFRRGCLRHDRSIVR